MALDNRFEIPENELAISTAKSHGKGGQNVNTRETKVIVRWNFKESRALDDDQKKMIELKLGNRINSQGEIFVSNSDERVQIQNKKEAIRILNELVLAALDPEIERVSTHPPQAEKERRLQDKHRESRLKELRQKIDPEDYL